MIKVGIVGHAAEKFLAAGMAAAKQRIGDIIRAYQQEHEVIVVSGGCHLGGVDVWAEEVAKELGVSTIVHKPTELTWGAPGGFRDRNMAIATDSDEVHVLVVEELPPGFAGDVAFADCYHCKTTLPQHVKSGACWTAREALKQQKPGYWHLYSAKDYWTGVTIGGRSPLMYPLLTHRSPYAQ